MSGPLWSSRSLSTPDPARSRSRRGAALAVVLLLLLALTVLAAGALRLARAEALTARSVEQVLYGELRARAVAKRTLGAMTADSADAWKASIDTLPSSDGWVAVREWISREIALVTVLEERDETNARRVPASRTVPVWTVDGVERVASATAIVGLGGAVVGGLAEITSSDFFRRSLTEGPRCDRLARPLDSLRALGVVPSPTAPLFPVSSSAAPPGSAVRLGALPIDSLVTRLTSRLPETVTPTPATSLGRCQPGPGNWGSPLDPTGPCRELAVAAVREGDLVMKGGQGQGVLVVLGDLDLEDGADFAGLILATDDVSLTGGSRVRGMLRVGGNVSIEAGSSIDGRACPVAWAVDRTDELRIPVGLLEPLRPGR